MKITISITLSINTWPPISIWRTENNAYLQSTTNRGGRPGALNINMKGLDIASLLSSWPLAPPRCRETSTDLVLDFPKEQVQASGNISIAELLYDKQRVG
ncbi:MAG: hypothetical protein V8R52_10075 [Coprobacter fastidiosus]